MKFFGENTGTWRVRYEYFDSNDVSLGEQMRSLKGEGVYHVPTGPQNPCHAPVLLAASSYYTVQVQVRNAANAWVEYSVLMTINLVNCGCTVAEIYFLEDRGSWRTLGFKQVASRRVDVSVVNYERPLTTNHNGGPVNAVQLFQEGGRYSEAALADTVFILTSEKITEHNREMLEEFLRSKEHYILTSSDLFGAATRRVLIDRGSKVLFQGSGVTKLSVEFRYNVPQRIRE